MVRDLVCGMFLDPAHALRLEYHGLPYYFCSHDCRVTFEDRPDEYIQPTQIPLVDIITDPLKVLVNAIHAGETTH